MKVRQARCNPHVILIDTRVKFYWRSLSACPIIHGMIAENDYHRYCVDNINSSLVYLYGIT